MKVGIDSFEIMNKMRDGPKIFIVLEISMIPRWLVADKSNPEMT